MLTEERWGAILELVEREKAVSVPELEKRLGVSASTIRRDLTQLNSLGKLIKVHGGATSIGTQYVGKDLTMYEKYLMNSDEKMEIARYAAELISPGDYVYIDAGTTTEMLVDCIREQKASYVTNSLTNARKLVRKGYRTFLT
ncbi:MAG: DeoR/GlpR transcriptional regulator, partial [Lachnospiraceae bacterium]|nr:DeoR/GlpR transcriptional regulator [Lachnospiraceae bacterium]